MAQSAAQVSLRRTGARPTGPAFQIIFRRKLWISRRIPQSDMVVSVVYQQLLEDYMNNNLISARELEPNALPLLAKLGALQVLSRPKIEKSQLSTYVGTQEEEKRNTREGTGKERRRGQLTKGDGFGGGGRAS